MSRVPIWTSLAVLLTSTAFANGEDGLQVPDYATEVEVRDDITIQFSQVDVMVNKDPVPQIAGVTDQFGGGMVLGEVVLKEPIPMSDLKALVQTNSSTLSFQCERGGLYEVEGTRLVGGDACEIITQEEDQ